MMCWWLFSPPPPTQQQLALAASYSHAVPRSLGRLRASNNFNNFAFFSVIVVLILLLQLTVVCCPFHIIFDTCLDVYFYLLLIHRHV
jgi:hypothetical protein